jgi:hypothetical protein
MAGDGLLRRLRRRRIDPDGLVGLPDSHPKRGLIAEPVRVARIEHAGTEQLDDGSHRVTFLVEVRASDDARCPAVAVEARITGPERERTVSGATDLLGRIRFRMAGPVWELPARGARRRGGRPGLGRRRERPPLVVEVA